MRERKYDRNKVVEYAEKWAYSRNPKYYNFDLIGGDCTSFVSQCIFAGSNIKLGDIAQLSFDGQKFGHTLIIVNVDNKSLEGIKIASHTFDNYGKSIAEYTFQKVRFIQIEGVRE